MLFYLYADKQWGRRREGNYSIKQEGKAARLRYQLTSKIRKMEFPSIRKTKHQNQKNHRRKKHENYMP